jgi:ATP-dependent Clp protease protease subunit
LSEIDQKALLMEARTNWLATGVDFETRKIQVNNEVNEGMASFLVRAIIKLNEISHDPIELHLASPGGSVYDCLSIYDTIRASPSDIHIICSGYAMSCGFIILLAGDQRTALPNTRFMMHSVRFASDESNVKSQEISVVEAKQINEVFLDIMTERTKRPKSWWRRMVISHDKYFNVAEAKEIGLLTAGPVVTLTKKVVKKNGKRTKSKVSNKR